MSIEADRDQAIVRLREASWPDDRDPLNRAVEAFREWLDLLGAGRGVVMLLVRGTPVSPEDLTLSTSRPGRRLIHSFAAAGPVAMGCDRDVEQVAADVRRAERVAWVDGLAGHDLWIQVNAGDVHTYDVKRPAEVPA